MQHRARDRISAVDLTSWTPLITVAGTLGGTAFGSAFTLFANRQTRRQTEKLALEAKQSALRDDRRDAIYAFIEAAQEVDRHVDAMTQNEHREDEPARAAMHQLWYRYNCIKVLASERLGQAAQDFTWRLHCALWLPLPSEYEDVYVYMTEERNNFMEVAARELYTPDTYADSPSG
jgi:hypothetical protein